MVIHCRPRLISNKTLSRTAVEVTRLFSVWKRDYNLCLNLVHHIRLVKQVTPLDVILDYKYKRLASWFHLFTTTIKLHIILTFEEYEPCCMLASVEASILLSAMLFNLAS